MATYPYYPQQQAQQFAQNPYMMQPRQQFVEQPQPGIKGRPVSSIEEVRATSIDFDGSIFFFPDLANRRIYTKQINIDGTSTLNTYELKNEPAIPQYVTREEFELALTQLQQKLIQPAAVSPEVSAPIPQAPITAPPAEQQRPKLDF